MEKKQESCGFGKKCKRGYCPTPTNRVLYKKLKTGGIRSSSKWPSRFAAYDLVNNYKKSGGKYTYKKCKMSFGENTCCGCNKQQNSFGICNYCNKQKSSFGACGCNKQKNSFGSAYTSFYPKNYPQNTFQTPSIKNCLNIVYGPEDASYTNTAYQPDITTGLPNPGSFGFGKKNKRKNKRNERNSRKST